MTDSCRCASVVNSALTLNPLATPGVGDVEAAWLELMLIVGGLLCTLIVSLPVAGYVHPTVLAPRCPTDPSVSPYDRHYPSDRPVDRTAANLRPVVSGGVRPTVRSRAIAPPLGLHFDHFRLKAPHNLLAGLRINAIRCETGGALMRPFIYIFASIRTQTILFHFSLAAINDKDLHRNKRETKRMRVYK